MQWVVLRNAILKEAVEYILKKFLEEYRNLSQGKFLKEALKHILKEIHEKLGDDVQKDSVEQCSKELIYKNRKE